MAKKAEEKENTTAVNAETQEAAPQEMVTVPKEQLEALIADVKLMKKQLSDEGRTAAAKDRRSEMEEQWIKQTIDANAEAAELVDYYAPGGAMRANKNFEVSLNGKQYIVPRGKPVRIPRTVKEIIENSIAQENEAYGMQEEQNAAFEKDEAKQLPGGITVTL